MICALMILGLGMLCDAPPTPAKVTTVVVCPRPVQYTAQFQSELAAEIEKSGPRVKTFFAGAAKLRREARACAESVR